MTWAEHRGWKQILCAVLVLAVLLARVPRLWQTGEFVAEDGWVFFADAWNHPGLASLLLPYAGYFHLLPRLIAAAESGLPLVAQPGAFALTGLILNAAILSAFYLPAFRRVLPSDAGRLAVVLFLALAPNAENLGLLLGLHWYLAFLLALLLVAPVPAQPVARYAHLGVAFLCVWSSPSTLVLLPFAALAWWRSSDRAARIQFAAILAMLAMSAVALLMLRAAGAVRTAPVARLEVVRSVDRLVLRGWLGTGLLGPQLAGFLARAAPLLLDLAMGGVAAALCAWLWRRRAQAAARTAAILLGAAVLMLLLSLARSAYVTELAGLAMPRHVRYATAPTLLLYVALGILVAGAAPAFRRGWLAAAAAGGGLLAVSLPGQNHWARPAVRFHLRDALPAIRHLRAQYAFDHQPASLYIPSDVPYWGPVLEVGGGEVVRPEVGAARALGATPRPDGGFDSWLGRFRSPGGPWIEHAALGRLEFTGIEQGRVFFRDARGALVFTSPLLYPRWWKLDHFEWTLIEP
ncbi:MAG TPA: hypothetical protein VHD61_12180 [Lacunisphaera sp.]|nr:hypothetical protein [Lacunisphaera sp.]